MVRKITRLDEKITIAGYTTTIWEQWQLGNAYEFRYSNQEILRKSSPRHWVTIIVEKDPVSTEQFDISEADFEVLRSGQLGQ
jgi:hypothetical protein